MINWLKNNKPVVAAIIALIGAIVFILFWGCSSASAMGRSLSNEEREKIKTDILKSVSDGQSNVARSMKGGGVSPSISNTGSGTQSVTVYADPAQFEDKMNATANVKERVKSDTTDTFELTRKLNLLGYAVALALIIAMLLFIKKQSESAKKLFGLADSQLSLLIDRFESRAKASKDDATIAATNDDIALLQKIRGKINSQ